LDIRSWGSFPARVAGPSGRRHSVCALTFAITAGLLLSGCGDNGVALKKPSQILKDSAAALSSAKSFEVEGKVSTGSGTGTFTFKVGGVNLGEGSFSLGKLKFHLAEVNKTDYVKSATLWEAVDGGALQQLLANRWVSIPASNPLAKELTGGVAALTSAKSTAASLTKGDQKAKREGRTTVDQQGVVKVALTKTTAVFVATSGSPYPVRVTASKGGYLDLSNFDTNFSITRPKGSVNLLDVIAGLGAGVGGHGS
jgi:hypothetical protein